MSTAQPHPGHHGEAPAPTPPSAWVRRWATEVTPGAPVLDVAAGAGRHSRLFLDRGHPVTAVDRDITRLPDATGLEVVQADLDAGEWPLPGRRFGAVVVVNYLHRPLWSSLIGALAPGGLLLHDTFMTGPATGHGPRNPEFLLTPGELREVVAAHRTADGGRLQLLGHREWTTEGERPAHRQAVAARAPA